MHKRLTRLRGLRVLVFMVIKVLYSGGRGFGFVCFFVLLYGFRNVT